LNRRAGYGIFSNPEEPTEPFSHSQEAFGVGFFKNRPFFVVASALLYSTD